MARGLALPVGKDSRGRAKVVSGSEHTSKLIRIGLQVGESTNPYQSLGLPGGIIYAEPEVAISRFKAAAQAMFKQLESERRAKLTGLTFSRNGAEVFADLVYRDLETEPPKDETMTLSLGTTAR